MGRSIALYLGREEPPAGDELGKGCAGEDVDLPALCPSTFAPLVFFLSISRLTGIRSLIGGWPWADPDIDAIVTL